MIAAIYTQGGQLRFTEVPVPAIGEGDLLVRVEATSLCGTDVKIARHGHRKLKAGQTVILGHEFAGTITRVGSRVTNYAVGQRVGVAPNIGCGHCEMCGRGLMNMCPDYSGFGINVDGSHTEFVRVTEPAILQGNVIRSRALNPTIIALGNQGAARGAPVKPASAQAMLTANQ